MAADTKLKLTRRERDDLQLELSKKGVKQKLDNDRACANCGEFPSLACNTWSGDFVNGRECLTRVCLKCAHLRGGIVYCYDCGRRYR